jgi:hypothetical protein
VRRRDDRIELGRTAAGRGGWACPACVARVGQTRFGRGAPGPDPTEVRAELVRAVERAFERARAAGVIASGRAAVATGADGVVLVSADAGAVAVRLVEAPVVRLPWSSVETGRRLGRGPRSVLVARRSAPTSALLARLRLLLTLG